MPLDLTNPLDRLYLESLPLRPPPRGCGMPVRKGKPITWDAMRELVTEVTGSCTDDDMVA